MEKQPVENNQVQQAPVNPAPVSKKPSHWIIILIALVGIIFIGSIFILILNSQKSKPIPPSSIFPTTPFQPSPTQDPTANWKTYTNKFFSFEIKYPDNWYFNQISEGDFHLYFNPLIEGVPTLTPTQTGGPITLLVIAKYPNYDLCQTQKLQCKIVSIAGLSAKKYTLPAYTDVVVFEKNNYIFEFLNNRFDDNESSIKSALGSSEQQEVLFSQILSTFKFTDQEEQVVCTQDAKLCPDGSYVSRQGPNCEFAKCP